MLINRHLWWIRLMLGLLAAAALTGVIASRAVKSAAYAPLVSEDALLTAESGFLPEQLQRVLVEQGSPLAEYREQVGEQTFSAAELFWLASQNEQFGISPRALVTTFALEHGLVWSEPGSLLVRLRESAADLNGAYRAARVGQAKVLSGSPSPAEAALAAYFSPRGKGVFGARLTLQDWAATYTQLFGQNPAVEGKASPPEGVQPFLRLPFERSAQQTYPLEAWFDHAAPGQVQETSLLRFDGALLPGAHYATCWRWVTCYSGHNAVDFSLPAGTPVYAAAAGRVVVRIDSEGGLVLDHPNGYRTIYWHLDRIALTLPYQQVAEGELLGWSGNRGTSPRPHLHFGLRITALSRDVDPFGWIGANADPWLAPSTWMWQGDQTADNLEPQAHLFYGPEWRAEEKGFAGGSWSTFTTNRPSTSTNWGLWGTALAAPSTVTVQAYWPRLPENTSSAVYKIYTAAGVVSVSVNQREDGDRWVTLGTYAMNAGPALVTLSDLTSDPVPERRVVFDAVRWVSLLYLPAVSR